MVQKLLNSKQKILSIVALSIVAYPLRLGNISKDWSVDNMKKTGLNGYIYYFGVDYKAITVADILDIRKYLIKKNGIA